MDSVESYIDNYCHTNVYMKMHMVNYSKDKISDTLQYETDVELWGKVAEVCINIADIRESLRKEFNDN